MKIFDNKIKKNFGFGCMRLPMCDKEVDYTEFSKMIDLFLEAGFNYFDTAHGYIDGKSEIALRECLVKRYNREEYVLVNKLTAPYFNTNEDIFEFFDNQLKWCGVDYFDIYLMHAQDADNFKKFKKCRAYETAFEFKKAGKVKHVGISFHDSAEVLDEILTTYPEIEIVQLQFNYLDYEDASVQGRLNYEVCLKHNKPVIVMEPVRGGALVKLPPAAQMVFDGLKGGSNASYAIRYAAGFSNIVMTLSGMGNTEMMLDNIGYMKDFKPLDATEQKAVSEVCKILKAQNMIGCTDCKYCVAHCVKNIPIPTIFACLNSHRAYGGWGSEMYYEIHTSGGAKASDCIECGACEAQCPQHLEIRALLKEAAKEFEK